ncbi:hypothetical protein BC828DRAFT_180229 [Blastocladiella britannica]|nr:hypothetical protein BC828DRAFT_180229 [Blastocladiella britannica]
MVGVLVVPGCSRANDKGKGCVGDERGVVMMCSCVDALVLSSSRIVLGGGLVASCRARNVFLYGRVKTVLNSTMTHTRLRAYIKQHAQVGQLMYISKKGLLVNRRRNHRLHNHRPHHTHRRRLHHLRHHRLRRHHRIHHIRRQIRRIHHRTRRIHHRTRRTHRQTHHSPRTRSPPWHQQSYCHGGGAIRPPMEPRTRHECRIPTCRQPSRTRPPRLLHRRMRAPHSPRRQTWAASRRTLSKSTCRRSCSTAGCPHRGRGHGCARASPWSGRGHTASGGWCW